MVHSQLHTRGGNAVHGGGTMDCGVSWAWPLSQPESVLPGPRGRAWGQG